MKKFIVASLAAAIAFTPVSAMAGEKGAYLLGGIVGGLILSDIFNNHHRHNNYQQPVYAAPPPAVYDCDVYTVRRWDPYTHSYYYTQERNCYYR